MTIEWEVGKGAVILRSAGAKGKRLQTAVELRVNLSLQLILPGGAARPAGVVRLSRPASI